ncbi:MAG: HEPN domain-containing protein [Bacilli bacterium]|nr:HEPN domain-containing protein [Bacilli bacterium]
MSQDELTKHSRAILDSAKDTINSFFEIYDNSKKKITEQNQDLLRAIILFSGSTIDAIIKKLINDTIQEVIDRDDGANSEFKDFVSKTIQDSKNIINSKLLSELFVCNSPKEQLIIELKKNLTHNSLQSADEIAKTIGYFGIPTKELPIKIDELKSLFIVRNKIMHEMDVKLDSSTFIRNDRSKVEAKKISNELLNLSECLIDLVEKKLKQPLIEERVTYLVI